MKERYVAYVGTYTHENSVGIHLYDVDMEQGGLTERKVIPINNPSDLIVAKNGRFLYSIADEGVRHSGSCRTGDLSRSINSGSAECAAAYVEVDDENRYLFVGGHHDGRVTMMKLKEDGSIGEIADGIFHKGMGRSIAMRSSKPHVDCVKLTPDQRFLCAVDNGLDHIKVYRLDYENGRMKLADILRCPLESAPHMIRFSRNGKFAYVLYELLNQVDVYSYSLVNDQPQFEKVQSITTMAPKDDDVCAASGMEVSRDGKYLFCSNAGVNSVVIYAIDEETGMLEQMCNEKISGDYPKMLGIYPDGRHFMSLNHETNEITMFDIFYDKKYILMRGKPIPVDKPNCVYIHKIEG